MQNFTVVREHLHQAAECQKKHYNKSAAIRKFRPGDWVLHFYPPRGRYKLNGKYVGPYLVLAQVGEVNYKLQRKANTPTLVVHIDHLRKYHSEKLPESWLSNEVYQHKETQTKFSEVEQGVLPDRPFAFAVLPSNSDATPQLRRSQRTRQPPLRFRNADEWVRALGGKTRNNLPHNQVIRRQNDYFSQEAASLQGQSSGGRQTLTLRESLSSHSEAAPSKRMGKKKCSATTQNCPVSGCHFHFRRMEGLERHRAKCHAGDGHEWQAMLEEFNKEVLGVDDVFVVKPSPDPSNSPPLSRFLLRSLTLHPLWRIP